MYYTALVGLLWSLLTNSRNCEQYSVQTDIKNIHNFVEELEIVCAMFFNTILCKVNYFIGVTVLVSYRN
jgi:hypothetical protein